MHPTAARLGVTLLACLLLAACKERHEPVKPTVTPATAAIA